MPNFNTDPNSFGSAFKMRGTTLPGPFRQVATKTGARDVDEVTANKTESYAARGAGPTESSPMEQHGSIRGKFKTHGVPGGPGSPMEQKIWQKGGLKKNFWDPIANWNKSNIGGNTVVEDSADIGVASVGLFQGMKMLGGAISKTKWAQTPATQTLVGKAITGASETQVGKFAISALTKAVPVIGTAAAIGGGYMAGKGLKGALNWMNRGIRNVLVTGERTGNEEFKSQYGLKEGGGIDWKGHKGGAGQGELSKKNRKEKGITIDFK